MATATAEDTAAVAAARLSAHHIPRRSGTARAAAAARTAANSSRANGIANVTSPTSMPARGRSTGTATSAANSDVTSRLRAGACHSSGGVPPVRDHSSAVVARSVQPQLSQRGARRVGELAARLQPQNTQWWTYSILFDDRSPGGDP